MSPRQSAQILIALSLAYGATVAILGALGSAALGTFAVVGAIVLGGLWAIRGVFISRSS